LQDAFLNQCRKEGVRCIVYLVNGVQLRGVIRAFDNFTLLMEENGEHMIVYKHAVTTVQPMRRLADFRTDGSDDDQPVEPQGE
jgi:host factor-I protein